MPMVEPGGRSFRAFGDAVGLPLAPGVEPLGQRSSAVARIAAASSPALIAPALPIASVPTGTPAGIWTIDSRLSMPDSACDSTGTPSTGSGSSTPPCRAGAPRRRRRR
jgi:hypothetical protein